jgi:TonB-dependent receptor
LSFKQIVFGVSICVLFSITTAWGQTGAVAGSVTDIQNRVLQGAKVLAHPGEAQSLTDKAGLYTLNGLPHGQYTITIDYSGFETATQTLQVLPGQTVKLNVVMTISSNKQNVDVYTGREGGEIEAINRTFNADNIINVLPADVIISLPNANVADAIGRLPGVTLERDEGEGKYVKVRGTEPRLTHTTLDGVTIASPETVRQIKLDLIPADLVESVQINKTLQANMEGDGIGGSVDLRTKSAEDEPTVFLEGLGGYSPIFLGRDNYQFDGTLGKRFLKGKKLGILISGSYDFNGRGINDIEPGPAISGTYDLRDYRYFRDRKGFGGTIDYRLSDSSNLFLKGLYSRFNNFGEDWIYSPQITNFVSPLQGDDNGTVAFTTVRRRPVQDIGGLQLGGHHVIRRSLFDWDINSSVARTRDEGYSFAHFGPGSSTNPLNHIQYGLDVSTPLLPHLNVQNGVNIFDPTQYFYQGQQVQNFYNPEVDLGFGASLATSYDLAGHASIFEFGGRFRNEHKFVNQDRRNYVPTVAGGDPENPALAMSNFLSDFQDPNFYGGNYKFGPAVDYGKVRAFTDIISDPNTSDVVGNSFDQIEKVSAGYIMNTTNFGRFRLIAGLRIESTGENTLGFLGASSATKTGTTPIRVNFTYTDLLPSAALRYAITPSSAIRLVYGRGLSRPNFSDLIPFQSAPSGGGARDTVSQGNPLLQAEYADNIDVLYENNLPNTGLLQAGFFYKKLSNPILPTQTIKSPNPSITGNNLPYYLQQTINAGSAHVFGFEVAYQQHFTFLPGPLNGFGLSTNYAYTSSQANLPPFIDLTTTPPPPTGTVSGPDRGPGGSSAPLIGQAPNSFNVSPTYDKRGFSARLGVTYNQANLAFYNYSGSNAGPIVTGGGGGGINGPNGDNYFYSHMQIDLEGTYRLPKGFTAVAYGLNLNNEVFGFYQGSPNYPVQREFYRQTFGGGLRWSPTRRKK